MIILFFLFYSFKQELQQTRKEKEIPWAKYTSYPPPTPTKTKEKRENMDTPHISLSTLLLQIYTKTIMRSQKNIQAHTSILEWQSLATSKTASSPPSSRNFSLKLPPVFLIAPDVSERIVGDSQE